jgi:hypothetical protein
VEPLDAADDAVDVGVVPVASAVVVEDHGVRDAQASGERRDRVEQGQHLALERHRQAQPAPARVEAPDEVGEATRSHLDAVVVVGQPEVLERRAVQHR